MKLLLLDDNQKITNMLSQYLKLKGYDCIVSNNSKSGFDMIKKENFDCIILDLAMPELSGVDIINNLAEDGTIKDHKILILSASSISDHEIDQLLGIGAKACLKKPVNLKELTTILQSVISN